MAAPPSLQASPSHLTREEALAWAISKLGLSPVSPGHRVILTPTGLAVVDVHDCFAEIAIDRHWAVVADALTGHAIDLLDEFREIQVDGHQLAFALEQIPRAIGVRGEVR
jgi:hypothetical protein